MASIPSNVKERTTLIETMPLKCRLPLQRTPRVTHAYVYLCSMLFAQVSIDSNIEYYRGHHPLRKTVRNRMLSHPQIKCILPHFSLPSCFLYSIDPGRNESGVQVFLMAFLGRTHSAPFKLLDFSLNSAVPMTDQVAIFELFTLYFKALSCFRRDCRLLSYLIHICINDTSLFQFQFFYPNLSSVYPFL